MGKKHPDAFTRFSHFLIDTIVFTVIVFIIVFILARYFPALKMYSVQNKRLLAFVLYFLYYFLFETLFSSTPGKLITKTRVADTLTNSRPAILKIFVRTLCRFIPFEAFTVFFYENNLTWHDLISRTTVINKT